MPHEAQTKVINEPETSQFGKGFVYCLALFVEHKSKLLQILRDYEEMRDKTNNRDFYTQNRAAGMWLYGAADHLMELDCEHAPLLLQAAAASLQDRAFKWRLPVYGEGEPTLRDVEIMIDDAEKLLFETDKILGLHPIEAEWK